MTGFPEVPGGTWSFYLGRHSGTLYLAVNGLSYSVSVHDPTPENILAAAPQLVADRAIADVLFAAHNARAAELQETLGIEVTGAY